MKKLLMMIGAAVVAVGAFADGTTLTWNGADGASWNDANWLNGETPSAWVDGANAVFPAAATVSLDGTVTVSNLTTSGALTLTGTDAATYAGFVPKNAATLVFPGLKLADIAAIQGEMGGGSIASGTQTYSALGYHFFPTNGITKATVQFQMYQGLIKCVIVEFSDGEGGVYAKATDACYVNDSAIKAMGMDLISGYVEKVAKQNYLATSLGEAGYGICQLKASVAHLTLTGEATLGGAFTFSNSVAEVTAPIAQTWGQSIRCPNGRLEIRGLSSGTSDVTYGKTDPSIGGATACWLTANANDTVLTNVVLSRTTPVAAVMRGTSIGSDKSSKIYHLKTDGDTMTFQVQFYNGVIGGALVELKQSGPNVTARRVKGYQWLKNDGGTLDMLGCDLEAKQRGLGTGVVKNNDASSYGVKSLTLRSVAVPLLSLSAAGDCMGAVVDNAQVLFDHKDAVPNNYVARNAARVFYQGTYNQNNSNYGKTRRFESGSHLEFLKGLISEQRALYAFDGSTFVNLQYHNSWLDGNNYINNLELANGSVYSGYALRTGYGNVTNETHITSGGTAANTIDAGINLLSHRVGSTSTYLTNVLVLATTADLSIAGPIYDVPSAANAGARIVKRGNATLTLSGSNTFSGRMTVEAGTLALGSDDALPASAPLTLAGGSVLCGTATNATGTLTLAGNATINLGDGSISFADSSNETWADGATLNIVGTDKLPTRSLRFGTDGSGLTTAQLKHIRYNGEKVSLTDEGYLSGPKGLIITFF